MWLMSGRVRTRQVGPAGVHQPGYKLAAVRVAFDATLLDEPTTGISLAARELGAGLLRAGATVEAWGARRTGRFPRRGESRSLWALTTLPALLARERPPLFHATANFNLPLARIAGVALVLTVHDVVPLLLPDTVSTAFRWQFRVWLARSLRVAHRVVCVSQVAKDSVLERFDVAPEKLTVIHHGVDHVERLPRADAISRAWLDTLGLPEQFVLYAGALDARKNVELVLDAVERLYAGGRRVTLVLAGQRWFGAGRLEQRIAALVARGVDVRALGYLHETVFYELMRRASVFVFPSRYEGFGLPPLEAMSLGVPTIVSTAGSLPEICGDGALQVSPDDADALTRALDELLASAAARERWGSAGLARAQRFRWDTAAEATLAVYRAALGEVRHDEPAS